MNKRFKKGQAIYQICPSFCALPVSSNPPYADFCALVIERVVDACGARYVTFYDRGNDYVFHRRLSAASDLLFATRAEALAATRLLGPQYRIKVIDTQEHTDAMDVKAVAEQIKASFNPAKQ